MIEIAKEKLQNVFGYDTFRPTQEDIITNILDKKDTIVLMPTGGGKSICFQIPALVFEGITIVISPLISLMKDQVEALKANGVSAAYLNSSNSEEERMEIMHQCKNGELKLLYLAPETLVPLMHGWISELPISLVAIDEAHCVSMWGHDFRPEYTQLSKFRQMLADVPFAAFTATADKLTRQDIAKHLGMNEPKVYISSFDRPNISLEVRGNIPKKKKIQEIVTFIHDRPNQSGIIYCLSRKETEGMAEALRDASIDAQHYHAGLPSDERAKVQEDFINDETSIICATIAFGMGIDKSNVRWVIHNNLPKNVEGYYQEIGRAGRDGLASEAILYYNMRDVKLLADFARDSPQKDVLLEKLNRMLQFSEATSCRRKILLAYFSENLPEDCKNCDVCENPPKSFDGLLIAQKALSAIKRTKEQVGQFLLIDILRGAKTADVFSKGFQHLKTYGAGRDHSNEEWVHFITQIKNLGLVEVAYDDHFYLKVTPFGEDVLYGKKQFALTHFIDKPKREKRAKRQPSNLAIDEVLFNELRLLRKKIAVEDNVPAYIVFNDATLQEMSKEMPLSENEMLAISGIGLEKFRTYGEEFITLIKDFKENRATKSNKKKSTHQETLELIEAGLSMEDIAESRSLALTTVQSHFAKLYMDGKLTDLSAYVTDEEIQKINEAFEEIQETVQLKPYYDHFNQEMDYGKIRLGLAVIQKTLQG